MPAKASAVLTSYAAIEEKVLTLPRRRVVVPAAANPCILEAAIAGHRRGLADFILIDSRERIRKTLAAIGHAEDDVAPFEIIEEDDCVAAARLGVKLVREGKASLVGKGRLQTFELMGAILDGDEGLRVGGNLLCDVMVLEKPLVDEPTLIAMADPALCVLPSVKDKIKIMRNGVAVVRRLGITHPKIALLAALEVVKDTMPATVEAAEICRRVNEGEIPDCIVDGPISMDLACSPRAVNVKGYDSPVAGVADLLIVPNLEAGNILAKTIAEFTRAEYGHVIVGAKVPIIMSSRSDSSESKFNSLLLALLCTGQ